MKNRFHKFLALCMTAVLAVTFLSLPALAYPDSRGDGQYVLDSAGVLSSETEKEIENKNKALFRDSGGEIVIAAVDFLDGQDIDDYTYDMFNMWGIGSKERNNGLLLVMAVAEEDYYCIPGYGIEDYFTGSHLQDMLDEYVEPDFAVGDYDSAARKFFDAAYEELKDYKYNDSYGDGEYNQGGTYENYDYDYDYDDDVDSGFSGFSVFRVILSFIIRIVIVVVVVVVFVAVIRAISGGGGGGTTGGGGGGGFWRGMFIGNMLGNSRRNRWYGAPPPPGGFGPRPPRRNGGFGGFGGHSGGFGGHSGGFHSGGGASHGGFHGGGGSRGGGAGRR